MDFHDPVSSFTHLGTAVWAAFATLILLRLTRGHGAGRWAIGFYGLSMVLLYLASGTFHGLRYEYRGSPAFLFFQKIDKSAIFLLIAGSYLPVLVYTLRGTWRRVCLGLMGAIAALGIATLWLLPTIPIEYLVGIYVAMGLVGLVALPSILASVGRGGLFWIAAEGFFYIGGGLIEVIEWPVLLEGWVGPHELLHVCDIAGTLSHFTLVIVYVIRRPPLRDSRSAGSTADRILVDLRSPLRH